VGAPQYVCTTEGNVAPTTATLKYVCGVKAHANSGLQLQGFQISFDGSTASAAPALVEVVYTTWATNGPGTNSTSTTPRQVNGRVLTAGFTSATNWSSAPTGGLTPVTPSDLYVPQYNGTLVYRFPEGDQPDTALAEGFVMRVTATFSGTLNVRASLTVARC
jgi:hypothetical protein